MAKIKLSPIEEANKKAKAQAKKQKADSTRKIFNSLLLSIGAPAATPEFKFHPTRQWAFDYAWPDKKIALEVEGGVFTNGAHTRGPHFMSDMEKYNTAALLGWTVVRTVPKELLTSKTAEMIRQLYNQK